MLSLLIVCIIISLINLCFLVAIAFSVVRIIDHLSDKQLPVIRNRRYLSYSTRSPTYADPELLNWDGMPREGKNWDGISGLE